MNNYILILDLNNINDDLYNNTNKIGDDIEGEKMIEDNIIKKLLNEFYNIKNYIQNNIYSKYYYDILNKYNITEYDMIIDYNNNNYKDDNIKKKDKGILIFNIVNLLNDKLINIINILGQSYDLLILNRLHDMYLIYFDKKKEDINNNKYDLILKKICYNDIRKLILYQKIKNIPNLIKNNKLKDKINEEIKYIDIIDNFIHNKFFSNINNNKIEIIDYANILINNLNIDSIEYIFNNKLQYNSLLNNSKNFIYILDKLNSYNNYLTSIIDFNDLFKYNVANNIIPEKSIMELNLDDLFNLHKINEIYTYIKKTDNSNIKFMMNSILDNKINIINNKDLCMNEELFINNIIFFLNKLIHYKIKKIIYKYNYHTNNIFINNMHNLI